MAASAKLVSVAQILQKRKFNCLSKHLGPVVQSIVSLPNSLRG